MPIITGGTLVTGLSAARIWKGAGAPVANTTGLGTLAVGDLYTDTTNGKLYIVTATNGTSTITFVVVGTQT